MSAPIVADPGPFALPEAQRRIFRWFVYLGFAAMVSGVAHGLAQALSYAGINILPAFPALKSYYQGLTMHGVTNALVLTFAFGNGFLMLMTARAVGRPLNQGLVTTSFALMLVGVLMTVAAIATNTSSVLYTAYAPLQAHWAYYLGLALVVVSTWAATAAMVGGVMAWRRDNPGGRVPLLAFISIASWSMWCLASTGIAVSFLGFLLPWSLGWLAYVDPLLNRTLFWFTAHAIVYAWLLPAYVSWYALVPRQAGGKIISDMYTRVVFILFLLLSIPTGFHHQYTDPGISQAMKTVHLVLTFGVFFPSLATAFSVMAALEMGGRSRGGRGLLGWIPKLPWGDPSLSAQLLAMLTFVLGGATGLVNASYTMNQVIHNTTWVPGHFHMTVGSAVALSFMGIAYWLVPYLTGRGLWGRRLAVWQGWVYSIGVFVFARGMISGGLAGMPRRTFIAQSTYAAGEEGWRLAGIVTGIGGTLMTIGALMFFVVLVMTVLAGDRAAAPADVPWSETITAPALTGWEPRLDRLRIWVVAAIILILIAYAPFFATYLPPNLVSPGYRFF
jgi:cytochrome c oxidase subunit I